MTQSEFDKGHDGLHVPLTCENHSDLRWSCKKVALSLEADGKYRWNGSRHIFFSGHKDEKGWDQPEAKECECSHRILYALIESEVTE